jgi:glycine hydroxymethyltransferase
MDEYEAISKRVLEKIDLHHKWFSESLPLIASENVTSVEVRSALASDFGHRYAEGWPGERVYAGCRYIDEVELIAIELAKRLLKAEFVDVRPVSGVAANLAVYSALSAAGDTLMALSIPNGGHISMGKREFGGTAGLVHNLNIEYFAFDKELMNIDADSTKKKVERMEKKPRIVMFGASLFLFPHPVKELANFFKGYGAVVCYDAAHVIGLIAGGTFQDPLREGAEVMTFSTHKTLFGPQGGAIATDGKYVNEIKQAVFPGVTSNHHLHSVAAKAIAFAEYLRFGAEYSSQVVRNAKALAQRLKELGLHVLGENSGFTESHQVALDVTRFGDGTEIEKKLERCNIIVNRQLIPGDLQAGRHYTNPGGIRLGVSELTRLGMRESEMIEVANLIYEGIASEDTESVASKVRELRRNYQTVEFSFSKSKAYIRV